MLRAFLSSLLKLLPEGIATTIRRTVRRISSQVGRTTPNIVSVDGTTVQPSAEDIEAAARARHIEWRRDFADSYFRNARSEIERWVQTSREDDNFTYDLTDQNLSYLAATISAVTRTPIATIEAYLREPEIDLGEYLARHAVSLPIDNPAAFGRWLGWYAVARAIKPRLTIETGVHQGLGSVLLCSALKRNAAEGVVGKYYGTDINPSAGALLTAPYDQYGTILFGDSLESLTKISEPIDLFINDSDHSEDYKFREYELVAEKLSKNAVVLGDNSHVTDAFLRFSIESQREFLFFKEQPKNHWYPGAGIGISFRRDIPAALL